MVLIDGVMPRHPTMHIFFIYEVIYQTTLWRQHPENTKIIMHLIHNVVFYLTKKKISGIYVSC